MKKIGIYIGLALIVVVGIFALTQLSSGLRVESFDDFVLLAHRSTPSGITPTSTFVLTTDMEYEESELKEAISFTPEAEFEFSGMGDNSYLITPVSPLLSNTDYTLSITPSNSDVEPLVRAYFVYDDFEFLSFEAMDYNYSDTLCFSFTSQPENMEAYVSFTPPLAGEWEYIQNTAVYHYDLYEFYELSPNGTNVEINISADLADVNGNTLSEPITIEHDLEKAEGYPLLSVSDVYNSFDSSVQTFLPDEIPYLLFEEDIYNRGKGADAEQSTMVDVTVSVYSVDDLEDYLYYMEAIMNVPLPFVVSDKHEEVLNFSQPIEIEPNTSYINDLYPVYLPQTLSMGRYIVITNVDGEDRSDTLYSLIQISPVAHYSESRTANSLLWLNDSRTAAPISQTAISYGNFSELQTSSTKTNEDGIAFLQLDEEKQGDDRYSHTPFYYYTSKDGALHCDYLNLTTDYNSDFSKSTYGYIYTDKSIYRNSDNIAFWGMLHPREGGVIPENVNIVLLEGYGQNIVYEAKITMNEDGSFSGNIPFADLGDGYYEIALSPFLSTEVEKDVFSRSLAFGENIEISDYKVPDLIADIKLDKDFYYWNEDIVLTGNVSYFNGTPYANGELMIDAYGYIDDISADRKLYITTDENGNFSYTYPLSEIYQLASGERDYYYTSGIYFRISSVGEIDVPLLFAENAAFFKSDIIMENETITSSETTLDLNINAHELDASHYTMPYWEHENGLDSLKGDALEKEITATLYKGYQKEILIGERYDSYTGLTVPEYDYEYVEEVVEIFNVTTDENGEAVIKDLPMSGIDDINYFIKLNFTDTKGDNFADKVYLHRPYENFEIYYMDKSDYLIESPNISPDQDDYLDTPDTIEFVPNEIIPLSISQLSDDMSGNIMLSSYQFDYLSTELYTSPDIELALSEENIPKFQLTGAYFDGKYIHPLNSIDFELILEERALDVTLATDKESYKPSEEAKVEVIVNDREGQAVANATVALSLVDEAVFALRENDPDFLNTFYYMRSVNTPTITWSYHAPLIENIFEYFSGNPNLATGGGKGGGGGDMADAYGADDSTRDDFRDSLGIITAQTDENGKASLSYTLPDRLTDWRFTALAVNEKSMGDNATSTISTLPYYIRAIISPYYLSGDNISFSLSAMGSSVNDDMVNDFIVSIEKNGDEEASSMSANADMSASESIAATNMNITGATTTTTGLSATDVIIEPLTEGDYYAIISLNNGENSDAVKLPFTVVDTTAITRVQRWEDVSDSTLLPEIDRGSVSIHVYNPNTIPFYMATQTILGDNSRRYDVEMATKIINKLTAEMQGESYSTLISVDGYSSDNKNSYYTLTPYQNGPEDYFFTAQAAVMLRELGYNDGGRLMEYNLDELRNFDTPEDGLMLVYPHSKYAALYLIISSLDFEKEYEEEMLSYFDEFEKISSPISPSPDLKAMMYYISAISYYDQEKALELFESEVLPALVVGDNTSYIPSYGDYNSVELTADFLMASMLVGGDVEEEKLLRYIAEKQSNPESRGMSALPLSLYATRFTPSSEGETAVISYNISGEVSEENVPNSSPHTISLSYEEYQDFSLSIVSGEAVALIEYEGLIEESEFSISPNVEMLRGEIQHVNGDLYKIVYEIGFDELAAKGRYTFVDFVPSNMRLLLAHPPVISSTTAEDYIHYESDMQNSRLIVNFESFRDGAKYYNIEYYMIKVSDTEAVFDTTYLYNSESMTGTIIPRVENISTPEIAEETTQTASNISMSSSEYNPLDNEYENAYVASLVEEKLKEIISPNDSDTEKLHAIYSYIIENTHFADPVGSDIWMYRGSDTDTPPSYVETRAISPLLFGLGSCEDYASAFVLLAREAGFEAEYVFGQTLSTYGVFVDHAWAVVELDGVYYHVDPQLEDNISDGVSISNQYFLKSDRQFFSDHSWGEGMIVHRHTIEEELKEYIRNFLTPPKCPTDGDFYQATWIEKSIKPDAEQIEAELNEERLAYISANGKPAHLNENFAPPIELNPLVLG